MHKPQQKTASLMNVGKLQEPVTVKNYRQHMGCVKEERMAKVREY
jgi:hypothetical protein